MNPLEHLKSVLCGPDGKCCITGSDEDRAIVDRALQALAPPQAVGPVALDHIACIEDGVLRYVAGRKAPAYDCELFAMPDGKAPPKLYTAPQPPQSRQWQGLNSAELEWAMAHDLELARAHEVLDSLAVELQIEKAAFECLGDYITAVVDAVKKQPAQQEIDWKDQYEKQKRRAEMWIAKYEADIGPLEKAGPVKAQPLTDEQMHFFKRVLGVAIAGLYEYYKADVMKTFTAGELQQVVDLTESLKSERVEDIYRKAWNMLNTATHGIPGDTK